MIAVVAVVIRALAFVLVADTTSDEGGSGSDPPVFYRIQGGIVIFKDHCMSIICADGVTGTSESVFIDKGGNHYYLCETTAPDWAVGTTPDRLRYSNETAIYVYYVG